MVRRRCRVDPVRAGRRRHGGGCADPPQPVRHLGRGGGRRRDHRARDRPSRAAPGTGDAVAARARVGATHRPFHRRRSPGGDADAHVDRQRRLGPSRADHVVRRRAEHGRPAAPHLRRGSGIGGDLLIVHSRARRAAWRVDLLDRAAAGERRRCSRDRDRRRDRRCQPRRHDGTGPALHECGVRRGGMDPADPRRVR